MNMRTFGLIAGVLLIVSGIGLLFFDRERFAVKNFGYVIWGVGLILANWDRNNKVLTNAGTVLMIVGPLILAADFLFRFF